MKLILHIGSEGKGTQAIQNSLAETRPYLRSSGLLYPFSLGSRSHDALISCFQEMEQKGSATERNRALGRKSSILASFERELLSKKPERVVLSCEYLSSWFGAEDVRALGDYLSKIFSEIQVIFYVRAQDELRRAQYISSVTLNGRKDVFGSSTESADSFDFKDIASRWENVFGTGSVLLKNHEQLGDTLLEDFFDTVDIQLPESLLGRVESTQPDDEYVEYLRYLNRHVPVSNGVESTASRNDLLLALQSIALPGSCVAAEAVDANIEQAALTDHTVGVDGAFEVMANLWEYQQAKIVALKEENLTLLARQAIASSDYKAAQQYLKTIQTPTEQVWELREHIGRRLGNQELIRQARFRRLALKPSTKKLSLITACMGRLEHLKQTLPLRIHPDVENIVVDWSCPDSCGDWVEKNYPEVKVVRITGETIFNLSKSRNAGILAASGQYIGMLDADLIVSDSFLKLLPFLNEREYFVRIPFKAHIGVNKLPVINRSATGESLLSPLFQWRSQAVDGGVDKDKTDLSGFVVFPRSVFNYMIGFDINIDGYAGEDIEFRIRLLLRASLNEVTIPHGVVDVISHADDIRTENYEEEDKAKSMAVSRAYRQMKYGLGWNHDVLLALQGSKLLVSV